MVRLNLKKVLLIVVCLLIIGTSFVLLMQQPESQPPVRVVMGPFFAHYILCYPLENEFVKPPIEVEIGSVL